MISKELLKKVHYIEICSSKIVNTMLAEEYRSVFMGRGMEFSDVREYQYGDEIRAIDWNVTARMGHPYVKNYVEEREQYIFFLVDLSASGTFGSIDKTKNETATELCALLAFSAIKNNDRVGLIIFTDRIELFIPPDKGSTHVLHIIRELLSFSPKGIQTDITLALEYLGKITEKQSVVFLISDFHAAGFEKQMRIMGQRHDIIAVSIIDPREICMPHIGLVELQDAETGRSRLIDIGNADIRRGLEKSTARQQRQLYELFSSADIDLIEIFTGEDYVNNLISFFRMREKRLQRRS